MSDRFDELYAAICSMITERFFETGELSSTLFMQVDGMGDRIVVCSCGWASDEERTATYDRLRRGFGGKVEWFVWAVEAWVGSKAGGVQPRYYPKRTESLFVTAKHRDGRAKAKRWDINRRPLGLAPPEEVGPVSGILDRVLFGEQEAQVN